MSELPPVTELVPHQGPMSLLDRVIAAEGERLSAEVVVPAVGLFSHDGGVGAWVGIEYMAQAVAAWAGWQARQIGEAPRIGLLLGTRRYRCDVARFAPGQRLRIDIERGYQADNGLGQFDCRIHADGVELASALLTVFGPKDPSAFLNGEDV
ncbi:putative hotdog family 3-hydroxylacyl-ACP dehydratase [Pelomonas saccharophila]|uniref:Hotdog family 3-hydroxylacyl-ACP dehydratase n=1 Tax=Roseateles saccharophilus TaxID=304 RepID=A0ABU1YL70_ROSSA|nr:hotdog family protein [Roseateles saccharophilus]MDR7269605.1 putative hotdog family 3-hydroxylacyl-ACP dehydratase [Roseateles saccharophilus]